MKRGRVIFLGALIACWASAQTRLQYAQVQRSLADTRCPGPSLTVTAPTTLTIGRDWTPSNPCYLPFSVLPPGNPDPLVISSITSSLTVNLSPTGPDDTLYVWATEPGQQATRIIVGVTSGNTVNCPSCTVVIQSPSNRTFPAGVIPLGWAMISNHRYHPKPMDILAVQAIHMRVPASVISTDGGFLIVIEPQTQLITEIQKTASKVQDYFSRTPPNEEELASLRKEFNSLQTWIKISMRDVGEMIHDAIMQERLRLMPMMKVWVLEEIAKQKVE